MVNPTNYGNYWILPAGDSVGKHYVVFVDANKKPLLAWGPYNKTQADLRAKKLFEESK